MKKVLLVFGTRPEAIKMAPLVNELKASDEFKVVVAVTGQHREMLDQVLSLFRIVPDFDLNVMKQGQDLFDVTATVLTGMREVIGKARPDVALVHGDTATTFAASLAAFYSNVKIGHVEAGLRTHNLNSPWPEEANRQLTGRLATWHFAPTSRNKTNLLSEGINEEKILVTGNTVIDALQWVTKKISNSFEEQQQIRKKLKQAGLNIDLKTERLVLVTGHRRENFGEGFTNICTALSELAAFCPTTHFIYPVHLNPNVQKPVKELLSGRKNIHLINPLSYEPFVWLLKNAYLVLTDSGGVQEEAPGLGKPVLVMRDTTERPEAVQAGTVKLVGTSKNKIIRWTKKVLTDQKMYKNMAKSVNPYGDGRACERISAYLRLHL